MADHWNLHSAGTWSPAARGAMQMREPPQGTPNQKPASTSGPQPMGLLIQMQDEVLAAENTKALAALWADPAATEAVRTLAAGRHSLRTVERAILHLRGHAPMAPTPPETGLEATNAP